MTPPRAILRLWLLIAAFLIGAPAFAKGEIAPYLEVQQVLDADFDHGDVLTYTALAAGVDGSITTRRVEAQISYRFEYRIPWNDDLTTDTVHSGLARARAEVVPNLLSVEGGAIATRTRSDIRGSAPIFLTSDSNNITQVYGIYAGPDFSTTAGPLSIQASYRLSYVAVDDDASVVLPSGQPVLDRYDHSTAHDVSASIGMARGALPFAWTVSGGYTREDASQLDARYTGKYGRADVIWPVGPHIALTGGAGYEKIAISERAPVRDADGIPVVDNRGRFVTDPASPRVLAYQTDGLIWDVGVIWKPNRRTTVQARGGERYGGRTITGSVDYQIGRHTALHAGVYDGIESFGRALAGTLVNLPTSFNVSRNPLTGEFGGCVFGTTPGTGACFDDALQSIATANYRSRGAFLILSGERGPWTFDIGGGYANHKYLAPQVAGLFSIDGVVDESASFQADATRRLSSVSGVTGSLFANWYSSGIAGAPDVTNIGATASYDRMLMDHLLGYGSVGLYNYHIADSDSATHGQLVVGLRYQF